MSRFWAYLRGHAALLVGAALSLCLIALVTGLEEGVNAYALVLGGGALIGGFAVDGMAMRRRRTALREACKGERPELVALPAPGTPMEADLLTLCEKLEARAQAESARADRERRELTDLYAVWAHQVKTPIAALRLLVQSPSPSPAEMDAELLRIEQYVEMALGCARMAGDTTDFVIAAQPLDPILRGCLKAFSRLFILNHLALAYAGTSAVVLTDAKWLTFAVNQVLSNALKYTNAGGIEVRADANRIQIRDTGVGIRPEDLPRVFERSFTGANGRADVRATGLGLYLARRALGNLGHDIHIESVLGEGTTVTIGLSRPDYLHE